MMVATLGALLALPMVALAQQEENRHREGDEECEELAHREELFGRRLQEEARERDRPELREARERLEAHSPQAKTSRLPNPREQAITAAREPRALRPIARHDLAGQG